MTSECDEDAIELKKLCDADLVWLQQLGLAEVEEANRKVTSAVATTRSKADAGRCSPILDLDSDVEEHYEDPGITTVRPPLGKDCVGHHNRARGEHMNSAAFKRLSEKHQQKHTCQTSASCRATSAWVDTASSAHTAAADLPGSKGSSDKLQAQDDRRLKPSFRTTYLRKGVPAQTRTGRTLPVKHSSVAPSATALKQHHLSAARAAPAARLPADLERQQQQVLGISERKLLKVLKKLHKDKQR